MSKITVTGNNAREVLAELLLAYAGDAAFERLTEDARFAHQSVEETAQRTAGNLLNSFVTRKPGGEVTPPRWDW